jgi:hypothetical protein
MHGLACLERYIAIGRAYHKPAEMMYMSVHVHSTSCTHTANKIKLDGCVIDHALHRVF